jgi:hypothetical protein
MIGEFPNLGEVWYNHESIANILSLAEVRKVCRVTMDSSKEPAMCVHRLDGTVMKFTEHPSGLYVFNPKNVTNDSVNEYTMISTVAKQKKMFSVGRYRLPTQPAICIAKLVVLMRPSSNPFCETTLSETAPFRQTMQNGRSSYMAQISLSSKER